jgi:TolA-binding protein
MNKKLFAAVLVVLLGLGTLAIAEEPAKKESGFSDWLKTMQQKVAQLVPKKSVPMTTGVAGVRGAKEDTHAKLYWKGKKGEEAINEEELTEFKEGLDRAAKGDTEGAIHEFNEFMKLYPDSALVPDVKKAIDMAKLQQLEEKKADGSAPAK